MEEMDEKILLYLAKGAHEVWICNDNGQVRYYSHIGELESSEEVRGIK